MNILDKIEYLMKRDKIKNRKQLSELSGIPYTTLAGFYTKGYDKMKLSTLKSLADFFGVTIDYLGRDEITDYNFNLRPISPKEAVILASDEEKLVKDYRGLNEQGQAVVRDHMEMVAATPKYKKYSDISIEKHA